MNTILTFYLFMFMQYSFDPCSYQSDYLRMISNFSIAKKDSLFNAIMIRDQSYRYKNANKEYDLKNLLEIAVLLSKYGHPLKKDSHKAYNIPTLACRHNPYIFTRHFYDVFRKYYKSGILDDESYYSYLETQHLGKFRYWYLKEEPKENIKESIQRIEKRLDSDNRYPLSEICYSYKKELANYKKQTDSLALIGVFTNQSLIDDVDSIIIHKVDSYRLLMTVFKGYGIDCYKMIKRKNKNNVYKFESEYNPMLLSIGKYHIYLIDPNRSKNKYKTFNKVQNDTNNK